MHYYPFNISDFSQSTKHLTILEKAIYRELIDLYYDKEAPLINDPKKLARLICAPDNLTDVEQVLNEFFTLVDNRWTNERCDKVIADYHSKLETASRAGKASARSRAAKAKASKEATTVERPLNEGLTNQELITKNQEPLKEQGKKSRAQFQKPTLQKVADHMVSKGATLGQAGTESIKFFNYYESNGWKVGKNKMVNWKSAATGWLARSKDYKPRQEINVNSEGWENEHS